MQRHFVKHLVASTILAFAILEAASAAASELPTYELMSFPATPHQISVMGSGAVEEQSSTPALTRDGMPASPHQIAVLAPRRNVVAGTNPATIGSSQK
jgi:hypothetical protein